MKNKIKFLLFLFIATGLMTSCKKDEEKTVTEKITGPSCWKIAKYEEKDDSGNYKDYTNDTYDACELDDCTKFNSNGSYITNDNGEKCEGTTDPVEEGTWTLSNSDKTLTLLSGGFGFATNIESITENQLVVTATIFEAELRITYKN